MRTDALAFPGSLLLKQDIDISNDLTVLVPVKAGVCRMKFVMFESFRGEVPFDFLDGRRYIYRVLFIDVCVQLILRGLGASGDEDDG